MAIYIFVSLSLLTVTIVTAKSCNSLSKPPSPFVTLKNQYQVDYNTSATDVGTAVAAKCHNPDYILSGPSIRHCKNDGKWSGTELNCTQPPPSPPQKTPNRLYAIIGGTVGGAVFVSVIVVILIIRYLKKGNLQKQNQPDQLIKDDNKRFFKVWTAARKRKRFVRADTLQDLVVEAANVFNKSGVLRIVLEEDGTEVTSDSVLNACVDKTLIVLAAGEIWWDANSSSSDGDVIRRRLTFDVCSKDRQKRKLFLVESLLDLFQQAMIFFAYRPTRACIEKDGTLIENDDVLFASAGSTIMLLASEDYWTSGSLPDISVETDSHGHPASKRMFKVWSEDSKAKFAVFADSLAGLHLAAAKAHGLQNPIEICILSSGETITRDRQLNDNIDEILFVRKPLPVYKSPSSAYEYIDRNEEDGRTDKVSLGHDYTYSRPIKYPQSKKSDIQRRTSNGYHNKLSVYETLPELDNEQKKGGYSSVSEVNISDGSVIFERNVRNRYSSVSEINISNGSVPFERNVRNGHGPYARGPTDLSPNRGMIESNPVNKKTNNLNNGVSPLQPARQQHVRNGSAIPMEDLPKESRQVPLSKLGILETSFDRQQDLAYKRTSYAYSDTTAADNFELMRKQNENKSDFTNRSKSSLLSRDRGSILITGGENISSNFNSDVLF